MPLVFQPTVMDGSAVFTPAIEPADSTWILKRALLLILLSTVICVTIVRLLVLAEAAPNIPNVPSSASWAATSTAPPPPAPVTTPSVSAPKTCAPFGAIPTPEPITLTAPGLQQVIDAPQTYVVYGNNASEVSAQLQNCLPAGQGGSFSGATSYWMGDSYTYQQTSDAQCRLADISVGIRVTQVLPRWNDTGNDALRSKWETFLRNLTLHENGHTALNTAEARALLSDLQNLPAMPCDHIAVAANTITDNHIAALNAANDSYDQSTGHGSLQGATW